MSLEFRYSPFSLEDIDLQSLWYGKTAGAEVARRYASEVERTVAFLATHPNLGRPCGFSEPELAELRVYVLGRPFQRHLIYYRVAGQKLIVFRVMDGARNLPARLHDLPGAE